LGFTKLNFDWDWPGAEGEFRRALDLNPNNADVRHDYASYLGAMSRFDEAIAEAKRAVSLDPLSLRMNLRLGWAYMIARRYDEAIDQYKKTLELDPNYFQARLYLAWSYTFKGLYPEAFAEYKKMGDYGSSNNFVGFLYAVSGRRSEALKVIERIKRLSAQQYVDPYNMAIPYAGLGIRTMP
jgi:adenylate cyclase